MGLDGSLQFRRIRPDVTLDPPAVLLRPLEIPIGSTLYARSEERALDGGVRLKSGYGRILIITWSAFLRLPFIPNRQSWTVFIDEIPQVCSVREATAPQTHAHLTDHLELRPGQVLRGQVVQRAHQRGGAMEGGQHDTELRWVRRCRRPVIL